MAADNERYMTEEMCDKRHGLLRRILDVAIGIAITLSLAAFGYAFSSNREIGETKTTVIEMKSRVDRLEQKIDTGFGDVLKELRKK